MAFFVFAECSLQGCHLLVASVLKVVARVLLWQYVLLLGRC